MSWGSVPPDLCAITSRQPRPAVAYNFGFESVTSRLMPDMEFFRTNRFAMIADPTLRTPPDPIGTPHVETVDTTNSGHRRPRILTMGNRKVITHGLPRLFWLDIYHYAMTASWPRFFAAVGLLFLLLNASFALIYMQGADPIANQSPAGFLGAFFFSVETLATVGYGDMHPRTLFAHSVATLEIFIGMSFIALFTGIMFARFSRPRARILFAEHPVIGPMDKKQTLTVRAANARQNVIVDASAHLRMVRSVQLEEGGSFRRLYDMELVRHQHPMFVIGWSIMHVVDENSPLFGETEDTLAAADVSFILTIQGVDETTSQPMSSRFTYHNSTIRWQHVYADLISTDENGVDHLDYSHFHETIPFATTNKP